MNILVHYCFGHNIEETHLQNIPVPRQLSLQASLQLLKPSIIVQLSPTKCYQDWRTLSLHEKRFAKYANMFASIFANICANLFANMQTSLPICLQTCKPLCQHVCKHANQFANMFANMQTKQMCKHANVQTIPMCK